MKKDIRSLKKEVSRFKERYSDKELDPEIIEEIDHIHDDLEEITRSDEKKFWWLKINPAVFFTSFWVVFLLLIMTLVFGSETMENIFSVVQSEISQKAGWFFILTINVVLVFCLWLMFSRYGNIRLWWDDAKSDFTYIGWLSMLFSAGMWIGLLFFGVAEPVIHFESSPLLWMWNDAASQAQNAMTASFLHWWIHAWALYAVVWLALAYFTFNLKLPLTIRSIFYPIFWEKIHGWRWDIIDIISVVATIFWLATSLGLGAWQVNQGLSELFWVWVGVFSQIIIIIVVTLFATISLLLWLDKGIRFLSEWNMRIAVLLLWLIVILGPTIFILWSFFQNIGHYLINFIEIGTWSGGYQSFTSSSTWHQDWTIFYWAWWIAWCPFVGIFIARISKGRTIREFLLWVVFVPSLFVFFWLTAFWGTALSFELAGNISISEAIANEGTTIALYSFLQNFPFYILLASVATLLVASFFITSSDSWSFVVDTLTSWGRHDAPKFQKIFWASAEWLVAAILLVWGWLIAMQAATISLWVLFAIIVLVICYSLYTELKKDKSMK